MYYTEGYEIMLKKIFVLNFYIVLAISTFQNHAASSLIRQLSNLKCGDLSIKAVASAQFFLKKTEDPVNTNEHNTVDHVKIKFQAEEDIKKFRMSVKKFLAEQSENSADSSLIKTVHLVDTAKRLTLDHLIHSNDQCDDLIAPLTINQMILLLDESNNDNVKDLIIYNHKKVFKNLFYLSLFEGGLSQDLMYNFRNVHIFSKEDAQQIEFFLKAGLHDPESKIRVDTLQILVGMSTWDPEVVSVKKLLSLCKNLKYGFSHIDLAEGACTQSQLVSFLSVLVRNKKINQYKAEVMSILEDLILTDCDRIAKEADGCTAWNFFYELPFVVSNLLQHQICTKQELLSLLQQGIELENKKPGCSFSADIITLLFYAKLLNIEEIKLLFENYHDDLKPKIRNYWQGRITW